MTKTELTGFSTVEINEVTLIADRCIIYENCCVVLLQQDQPIATIEGFVVSENYYEGLHIHLEVIRERRPPTHIYLRFDKVNEEFAVDDLVYRKDEMFNDNLTVANAVKILLMNENEDILTRRQIIDSLAWIIKSFDSVVPGIAMIRQGEREVSCLLKNLLTEKEIKSELNKKRIKDVPN